MCHQELFTNYSLVYLLYTGTRYSFSISRNCLNIWLFNLTHPDSVVWVKSPPSMRSRSPPEILQFLISYSLKRIVVSGHLSRVTWVEVDTTGRRSGSIAVKPSTVLVSEFGTHTRRPCQDFRFHVGRPR